MTRGLPPKPALGRHFPAPYVRHLKNPRCLAVDSKGNMYVGVGLSAASSTSWVGSASMDMKGLTFAGVKISSPESTGGLCNSKLLTSGSGRANRLTACALGGESIVYWAKNGAAVVVTDPWPRWRQVGVIIMMRQLLVQERATKEVSGGRRITSRDRAANKALHWLVSLADAHSRPFRIICQFFDCS